MARRKVLDINTDGVNLYCTFDNTEKTNPYRLYVRWYEYRGDRDYGWHRKLLVRYQNLFSVIYHIMQYCKDNDLGMTDVWKVG